MAVETPTDFASFVKSSEFFLGRRNIIEQVKFRPDNNRGEFLGSRVNGNREPVPLWAIGRISPSNIFVKPDGSFNKNFTNKTADKLIADVCFRFQLIDPEVPSLTPMFRSVVEGLRATQQMFPGKDHKNLLDFDGGYEKIKFSSKMFDEVSRLLLCVKARLTNVFHQDVGVNPKGKSVFDKKKSLAHLRGSQERPMSSELSELSSAEKDWLVNAFKPRVVFSGHLGSHDYSDEAVSPRNLHKILAGAVVAMKFHLKHHRFPHYHSFTGRFLEVYVLEPGGGAPDLGYPLTKVGNPLCAASEPRDTSHLKVAGDVLGAVADLTKGPAGVPLVENSSQSGVELLREVADTAINAATPDKDDSPADVPGRRPQSNPTSLEAKTPGPAAPEPPILRKVVPAFRPSRRTCQPGLQAESARRMSWGEEGREGVNSINRSLVERGTDACRHMCCKNSINK